MAMLFLGLQLKRRLSDLGLRPATLTGNRRLHELQNFSIAITLLYRRRGPTLRLFFALTCIIQTPGISERGLCYPRDSSG